MRANNPQFSEQALITEVAHTGTPILYLGFGLLVVVFLALDFVLLKAKGQHKVPVGEVLAWAALWFAAAMAFAGWREFAEMRALRELPQERAGDARPPGTGAH